MTELKRLKDKIKGLGIPGEIFNFESDIGNYEERKIGRDDFAWGFISTARVSDGVKPFETAVEHGNYNDGRMVIVDHYDTKAQAITGHAKWVKTMTTAPLPAALKDCANSHVQQLIETLGKDEGKDNE